MLACAWFETVVTCICLKQLCTWCDVSVCMIRNGSNVHVSKTTVHVVCFILFTIRNIHETNVHVSNTTRPNNVCALFVEWLRQLCTWCDVSLFTIWNIHETNVHVSNTTRPNNVCALCVQWLRQLCMLCDFSLFMIRNIHDTNVHMSNTTMHVATKHICTIINNASTCTPCCLIQLCTWQQSTFVQ